MTKILDAWKKDMFPWIKDFSDPIDEKRKKTPNELDFYDYLWFSPYAANIIMNGFFGFWVISLLIIAGYLFITSAHILGYIIFAISLLILPKWVKYYRLFNDYPDRNMYDLFLREY